MIEKTNLVFDLDVGLTRYKRKHGFRSPIPCSSMQGCPPILRRRDQGDAGA
jgi:hypothetical protein